MIADSYSLLASSQALSGFLLAFGLGVAHAFDADHVTAVSVLATRGAGAGAGLRAGLRWSLGHGLALFLAGTGALLLGVAIPEAWSGLAERGVGLVMIALGLFVAFELIRRRRHLHFHAHDGLLPHAHWHGHAESHVPRVAAPRPAAESAPDRAVRPGGHHADPHAHTHGALFVGVLHGLAGAVPVLIWLPAGQASLPQAAAALAFFGIGVAAAMALVSGCVGHVAGRLPGLGLDGLRGLGAASSVVLGSCLVLGAV